MLPGRALTPLLGLALASCQATATVSPPPARATPSQRPNVVLVVADDLGWGALGSYGQKLVATPALDRMAAEGMRFTQCYAGGPACAPSRMVLMTGQHTGHVWRPGRRELVLDAGDVSLAAILKSAGYRTGAFGKWGIGDPATPGSPSAQGFAEFFGYARHTDAHRQYPEFLWDGERKQPLPGNAGGKRGRYAHDVVVERAFDFVRRAKDGPFFLYLAVTLPHAELLAPEDSLAEYRGRFPEIPFFGKGHYADQPTPRAAYAGMVSRLDRDVGRLMALLAELGIDGRTVVFFTSDNGAVSGAGGSDPDFFSANGSLRGHKFTLYEGGIRVPMIVRWPGRVAPGQTSDVVWAFEDLYPTAAALAGAAPPPRLDGVSVVPTLTGEGRQERPEYRYWQVGPAAEGAMAVRAERWKALRPAPRAGIELYDLEADVGETADLAARHRDVLSRLEALAEAARKPPE